MKEQLMENQGNPFFRINEGDQKMMEGKSKREKAYYKEYFQVDRANGEQYNPDDI